MTTTIKLIFGFEVELEEEGSAKVYSPLRKAEIDTAEVPYLSLNGMFLSFDIGAIVKRDTGLGLFSCDGLIVVGTKVGQGTAYVFENLIPFRASLVGCTKKIERIATAYNISPRLFLVAAND